MPPPSAMELPHKVNPPAGLLNVRPLKAVPAVKLFVFDVRMVPVKISRSLAEGTVFQFAGVCHRPVSPPPVQVEVPAFKAGAVRPSRATRPNRAETVAGEFGEHDCIFIDASVGLG